MKGVTVFGKVIGWGLFLLAPLIVQAQTIKVTLLGTGSPHPRMTRFGPSILVEAGEEKLLFDCGRGVAQRLLQLQIPFNEVTTVLFTHLHSDHVVGFPDLWLSGWVLGRDVPMRVWGPAGTKEMMANLEEAYQFDIRTRRDIQKNISPQGAPVVATDFTEGVVYEQNGVKVTAFVVDHGLIKPAFGFRIDYAGRSVVLSGDTSVSQNLIRAAEGADLLIHEVVANIQILPPAVARARGLNPDQERHIFNNHTTPEQAGEVFTQVKPRLAVYSHIVPAHATAEDLLAPTRKTYSGPLEVGEDLMSIEVGDEIRVRRFRQ